MPAVGTLAWARRRGGRLTAIDRMTLLAQALLARMRREGDEAAFAIELDAIPLPDTALALAASELVATTSDAWLVNHCLRTYLWGAIVGTKERRPFDAEVLFVAALLHDLGLTQAGSASCFAVDGAFAADAFLQQHHVAAPRRRAIAEAISLHLNVQVPPARGLEAHLLHEGAAMDVIGARLREVHETTRDHVLARHPRLEMKETLVAAIKEQSRTRPDSRAAFLCSHGFITLIRRAPFSS